MLKLTNGRYERRCKGSCGRILPTTELLNLNKPHAVAAAGLHAPQTVKKAAPSGTEPSADQAAADGSSTAGGSSSDVSWAKVAEAASNPVKVGSCTGLADGALINCARC